MLRRVPFMFSQTLENCDKILQKLTLLFVKLKFWQIKISIFLKLKKKYNILSFIQLFLHLCGLT